MAQSKPPTSHTAHTLPFHHLSPQDFGRLCLWLVGREGYVRAEHWGLFGGEPGPDVVAYRTTTHGEELWYFQCMQHRSVRAHTLKGNIDKCLHFAEEKPHLQPAGIVFVTSCTVPVMVRQEVGHYCEQHGLACRLWTITELDALVTRHPRLLQEFFGLKPGAVSRPAVSSTAHVLPFDRLSPVDFERLNLWLLEREGYTRAEHLGLAGSEQGRDVIAYKPTPHGEELWYFQCKRYRSIYARTLKDEVDKYLTLVQANPHLRPAGVGFVVSCAISARVREEVGDYCQQHGLAYEFWALTELDMRVKRHPDLLREFFDLEAPDLNVPTLPRTATAQVLRFDQISLPDLRKLCIELFNKEGHRLLQVQPVDGSTIHEPQTYLLANTPTDQTGPETWVLQWLEPVAIDPSSLTATVEKIQHFAQTYSFLDRTSGIHFIHGGIIPAPTRTEVQNHGLGIGMKVRFSALTELDELAKRYPNIAANYLDNPPPSEHIAMESRAVALSRLLALCNEASLSSNEKGKALENFSMVLFESCYHVEHNVLTRTHEVDLWLDRDTKTMDAFYAEYGAYAIVECKNRSANDPVDVTEVMKLITKCQTPNVRLAFLVSLGPFTSHALEEIRSKNVNRRPQNEPLIVPVRRRDIEQLMESIDEMEDKSDERTNDKVEDWLRRLVRSARQDRRGFYSYTV